MASPLPVAEPIAGPGVMIHITGPDSFELTRALSAGDALVIGCNPACGVRLEDTNVAGMHCTLSFEDGQLTVDDWDTAVGTYVNGHRVARQMVVDPTAELIIGPFRIATRPERTDSPQEEEESRPAFEAHSVPVETIDPHQPHEDLPPIDKSSEMDDVWDSPVDDFDSHETALVPSEAAYDRNSFDDDDTADLLKVELDYLRTELAERDMKIAELEEADARPTRDDDDELPSRSEVEALADRLEDLLEELEQSDDRIKTLTELLRLSDEANVAAEEERSQMESWIGEVERRVGQWEGEWHAERDSLNKSIAELTAQRDAVESTGADPAQTDIIRTLRATATALQSQLAGVQSERDELQSRLQTAEVQSAEEQVTAAIEDALREERLQISQMKAEFARERAKMAQQQEEMQCQQGLLTSEPDVADIRIRAFREHLKEIRATEPDSRPVPTMSQRLGKLWRKIDGKPLDTD